MSLEIRVSFFQFFFSQRLRSVRLSKISDNVTAPDSIFSSQNSTQIITSRCANVQNSRHVRPLERAHVEMLHMSWGQCQCVCVVWGVCMGACGVWWCMMRRCARLPSSRGASRAASVPFAACIAEMRARGTATCVRACGTVHHPQGPGARGPTTCLAPDHM